MAKLTVPEEVAIKTGAVMTSAFRGAAIGTAVGGAALAGAVVLGGPIAWGTALIASTLGFGSSVALGTLAAAAGIGALGGAAMAKPNEKVADAQEKNDADEAAELARKRNNTLLDQQKLAMAQQAQKLGLTPNVPFNRGTDGPALG